MTTLSYADAMGEALDRLRGVGYEHGTKLVNHAPMAAEALACLGYADIVPSWVEQNLRERHYHERPAPRWALSADDEADWMPALGDFSRVADWSAMFERELAEHPWTAVLRTWWPRLLPGMSGVLTHGVIRTAHAVRSMAQAPGEGRPQRTELAQGLGYWAARYAGQNPPPGSPEEPAASEPDGGDGALAAFDELIADSAGHYIRSPEGHPVPLIHAITGPAAVRLVCRYLPAAQLWPSYLAAKHSSDGMRSYFAPFSGTQVGSPADAEIARLEPPAEADLVADAVELGDEHAIKLAEVAVRHNALSPDVRHAAASHEATRRLRSFLR
jgi:hypothetical protein